MKILAAKSTIVFGMNKLPVSSNIIGVQTTNTIIVNEKKLSESTTYKDFNCCFPFGEGDEYIVYCRSLDLMDI